MRFRTICTVFVLILFCLIPVFAEDCPDPSFATLEAKVYKVFDGDTISIKGGEKVRLLGIDTPEIGEPFAAEAKRFTRDLVQYQTVRLEFDVRERDTYSRLLAFVYVETNDGWVMVNTELVRVGLARLLFIPPNGRYRDHFEEALHEAMVRHQGMWGKFSDVLTEAMVRHQGMWGKFSDVLTLQQIEADPVTYVTEVVSVRLLVSQVAATESKITLYADESRFSFHVVVLCDSSAAFTEAGLGAWNDYVGKTVIITGTLECKDVRKGLSMTLTWPDQIVIEPE
jgi:endonuclease YncB( thermonuclease family)